MQQFLWVVLLLALQGVRKLLVAVLQEQASDPPGHSLLAGADSKESVKPARGHLCFGSQKVALRSLGSPTDRSKGFGSGPAEVGLVPYLGLCASCSARLKTEKCRFGHLPSCQQRLHQVLSRQHLNYLRHIGNTVFRQQHWLHTGVDQAAGIPYIRHDTLVVSRSMKSLCFRNSPFAGKVASRCPRIWSCSTLASATCTCHSRVVLAKLPAVDVVGLGITAVVAAVSWVFGCVGVHVHKKVLAKLPAMDVVGFGIVAVVAVVPWVFAWFVYALK